MLFSLYSSPVGKITRTYGLCVWLDADDTQLFLNLSFTPCEWGDALERVEVWMVVNKIQLNGDKTQIVLVSALRANAVVSGPHHSYTSTSPLASSKRKI